MSAYANPDRVVKLAPSDLTYLWDECRRCFWLKVKGVLKRPATPFPKVFTRLDTATKEFYFDKGSQDLAPELPPGRVVSGGLTVRSSPLQIPGHETAVVIGGRIDTALLFEDQTYGVIDFKTSSPNPAHIPFYSRQLHAYACAAENPAPGALRLSPVSRLGLLIVEPIGMISLDEGVAYQGMTHFLGIERDDDMFTGLLMQVLLVLERPEPPPASPNCSFCNYLKAGSMVLLTEIYESGD